MSANSGMNTIRDLTDRELENVSGGASVTDTVVNVVKAVVDILSSGGPSIHTDGCKCGEAKGNGVNAGAPG